MKLFRITNTTNGMTYITPEPTSMTESKLLEKLRKQDKICPALSRDLTELGESKFDVEVLSKARSGIKIAKLERLNIKMLGKKSYSSEPIMAQFYNL